MLRMKPMLRSFLALVITITLVCALMLATGDNPIIAMRELVIGAFGSVSNLAATLSNATPLIFTGLAVAVAFRAGVINIGGEGQMAVGAIAAALAGIYIKGLPGFLHKFVALFVSLLFGMLWAFIPGVLMIKFNTNETVTTIMLNYVAMLLCDYLVNYPFRKPGAPLGFTHNVLSTARFSPLMPLTRLNTTFILGVAIAIGLALMYRYRSIGYEWKVLGLNRRFAKYMGFKVDRLRLLALCLSGGLAGLGGAAVVLGIQYRYVQGLSAGYGFDGVLVSLMAANHPVGVILVAILFGALKAGGLQMEAATSIPCELTQVLQSVILLFMAAQIAMRKIVGTTPTLVTDQSSGTDVKGEQVSNV